MHRHTTIRRSLVVARSLVYGIAAALVVLSVISSFV